MVCMIALSSVLDDDLYGGAFSAVAIALRYAACGYAKAYIYLGLQDHLAPGFGKRLPDGDPAVVKELAAAEHALFERENAARRLAVRVADESFGVYSSAHEFGGDGVSLRRGG